MPGTNGHATKPERVALYLRLSSEEQREKTTIKIQREFLDGYCQLHGLEVAGRSMRGPKVGGCWRTPKR